jgi:hypothetical protein
MPNRSQELILDIDLSPIWSMMRPRRGRMPQVWRIFNLVVAGILVCGAAGLVGLAAALGDWNWWFAPKGAALPADRGET